MGNMDKNTETGNNKTQGAIIAALVIGLLVGFFIGRSWGQKYEEKNVEEIVKTEDVENASSTEEEVTKDTKDIETSFKTDSSEGEIKPEVKLGEDMKNETTPYGNGTGAVMVEDQNAGASVAVSKVTLSEAGWVVVRDDTGSGMGNILGAQWLPAGTHNGVSVDLLRKTEVKRNYFVVLHNDDGDKKFDKTKDLPIEIDGKPVSGVFSAR